MTIHYTGQLATSLGMSRESLDVERGTTLHAVVDGILARHGARAELFLRDAGGALSPSLLVIFDGEQADGDRGALDVSQVRELMFMSPIAGG